MFLTLLFLLLPLWTSQNITRSKLSQTWFKEWTALFFVPPCTRTRITTLRGNKKMKQTQHLLIEFIV